MKQNNIFSITIIALVCIMMFLGIGLVDPILSLLQDDLNATDTQLTLLFTSYAIATSAAYFFSGYFFTRLTNKKIMLLGIFMVLISSGYCSISDNVNIMILARFVWGFGAALFIGVALTSMLYLANINKRNKIVILFETSIGIGMALGPMLGGTLGMVSWTWPFAATALLMVVAFFTILIFIPDFETDKVTINVKTTLRAWRNKEVLIVGFIALFYNYAYFALVGYNPLVLEATALQTGLIFFCWGIMLALGSTVVNIVLTKYIKPSIIMIFAIFGVAICFLFMAIEPEAYYVVAFFTIFAGLFMGMANANVTHRALHIDDFSTPQLSANYNTLRFIGAAIAPVTCTFLATNFDGPKTAFLVTVLMVMVAVGLAIVDHKNNS